MSGLTAPDRRLTIALTALAYFMVTLDALVVVTALPSIHRDLGGSASTLRVCKYWAYRESVGTNMLLLSFPPNMKMQTSAL